MNIYKLAESNLEDLKRKAESSGKPQKVQYLGIYNLSEIDAELRKRKIVTAARKAYRKWKQGGCRETGNELAKEVEVAWEESLKQMGFGKELLKEFRIGTKSNERIDLFDTETGTAYELKASSNNSQHEFYKNCFKVLAAGKLSAYTPKTFVYMSSKKGLNRLLGKLGTTTRRIMEENKVTVQLLPLDGKGWEFKKE